jgi:hypothetical protein
MGIELSLVVGHSDERKRRTRPASTESGAVKRTHPWKNCWISYRNSHLFLVSVPLRPSIVHQSTENACFFRHVRSFHDGSLNDESIVASENTPGS